MYQHSTRLNSAPGLNGLSWVQEIQTVANRQGRCNVNDFCTYSGDILFSKKAHEIGTVPYVPVRYDGSVPSEAEKMSVLIFLLLSTVRYPVLPDTRYFFICFPCKSRSISASLEKVQNYVKS
jgi:hypothetical protein